MMYWLSTLLPPFSFASGISAVIGYFSLLIFIANSHNHVWRVRWSQQCWSGEPPSPWDKESWCLSWFIFLFRKTCAKTFISKFLVKFPSWHFCILLFFFLGRTLFFYIIVLIFSITSQATLRSCFCFSSHIFFSLQKKSIWRRNPIISNYFFWPVLILASAW